MDTDRAWAQERIRNHFSANRDTPYVAPRYEWPASPPIQRKATDGGDWRKRLAGGPDAEVATKRGSGAAATQGAAAIPQSGGAPLPGQVRAKMEPQLGADLSDVKVHSGGESEKAALKLGARAFTVGQDVHFGAGEFAPGTKEGDRLIAHELAHTVQAQKSGVQRKAEESGQESGAPQEGGQSEDGAEVSQPGQPAEVEADAVGDHVADQLHGGGEKEHGGGEAGREKAPAIGAKLQSGVISLAVDPKNRDYQNWLRKVKLGNPASETNQQLFEQRAATVEAYVGMFKKGGVNSKLPTTAKSMTVEQALIAGEVDSVNVRKLLTDLRDKFNK